MLGGPSCERTQWRSRAPPPAGDNGSGSIRWAGTMPRHAMPALHARLERTVPNSICQACIDITVVAVPQPTLTLEPCPARPQAAHLLALWRQHQGEGGVKRPLPVCPEPQRNTGRLARGAALHADRKVGGVQASHLGLRWCCCGCRCRLGCWCCRLWGLSYCSFQAEQVGDVNPALQHKAEPDFKPWRQSGGGRGARRRGTLVGESHAACARVHHLEVTPMRLQGPGRSPATK